MRVNIKVNTKDKIVKTEPEATINMILDELKSETAVSIDMKIPAISSNKSFLLMNNLKMISLNGQYSIKIQNIPMHHNSPNIYLP